MKTYIQVPEGGLRIRGITWPAGVVVFEPDAPEHTKLLLERGAKRLSREEGERLVAQKTGSLEDTGANADNLGGDQESPQPAVVGHRSRRGSRRIAGRS